MHEVTVGQFKAFVQATGYKTEAETDGEGGEGRIEGPWQQRPEFNWINLGMGKEQTDEHPVVNVSWNDAVAFCNWLSNKEGKTYKLPTEAQWEYTCRAGSTTRWHFGDNEAELEQYAWYVKNHSGLSKPVGEKLPNGFGVFDMYGNVAERCSDRMSSEYYASSPVDNPDGPRSEGARVARGGAFGNRPWTVCSSFRAGGDPTGRGHGGGFRPVLLLNDLPEDTGAKTTGSTRPPRPDVAAEPAAADVAPDRRAAEWALSIGGRVHVLPAGETKPTEIASIDDLPTEGFATKNINLSRNERVDDGGLKNLEGSQLRTLSIGGTDVTDAGLASMRRIPSLRQLDISATRVTDAGLSRLGGLMELDHLTLAGAEGIRGEGLRPLASCKHLALLAVGHKQMTSEFVEYLKELSQVLCLTLQGTATTDADLEFLREFKHLEGIYYDEGSARVSEAAVEALKAALPACQIEATASPTNAALDHLQRLEKEQSE